MVYCVLFLWEDDAEDDDAKDDDDVEKRAVDFDVVVVEKE